MVVISSDILNFTPEQIAALKELSVVQLEAIFGSGQMQKILRCSELKAKFIQLERKYTYFGGNYYESRQIIHTTGSGINSGIPQHIKNLCYEFTDVPIVILPNEDMTNIGSLTNPLLILSLVTIDDFQKNYKTVWDLFGEKCLVKDKVFPNVHYVNLEMFEFAQKSKKFAQYIESKLSEKSNEVL
jgi:hypothetical protein